MTTVAQQREQSNFIDNVQAFLPPDKLQRERSLAIERLAEASAALDAHLKTWTPNFYDNFVNSDQVSMLAGALMAREELEYALVIALNEVVYIDEELMGDNCSRVTIARIERVRACRAGRLPDVRTHGR